MKYDLITTTEGIERLCRRLEDAPSIAFDTEFVAEHTYRPELCLLQIAFEREVVLVDPLGGADVSAFWRLIVDVDKPIVVHAGREEMCFCLEATGRQPARLFDLQIAAGLVGLEYPAGYANLVGRILGDKPDKAETRTDWRRRPLSDRQLNYAADDVRHLLPVYEALGKQLAAMNRSPWMIEEMGLWQRALEESLGDERWRRVSGMSSLSARSLAIVRELWRWRDAEARRRNRPSRQIFRDDLIVELARRRSADIRQITAIRGLERGDFRRALPEVAQAIERALALPESDLPKVHRRDSTQHLTLAGQFLSAALSCLCRQQDIAAPLVGTAEDVRELIAWHVAGGASSKQPLPALEQGWRAEFVGRKLDDVLSGKVGIRIQDPTSDFPLAFVRISEP